VNVTTLWEEEETFLFTPFISFLATMNTEKSCLIGVDIGTSSVKAIAVDLGGNQLASAKTPLTLYSPARHNYLQDATEIRNALFQTLRMLTERIVSCKINAIGITGQSISLIITDNEGRPIYPVINHLDARAATLLDYLSSKFGSIGYFGMKFIGNLAWIKMFEPNIWDRIGMVFDVREYAGYLLTGKQSIDELWYQVEDVERYLQELGVPSRWLGQPISFTEVLGYVTETAHRETGLPAGTPVVVAPGDALASPFGSGVIREGDMADISGVTEIMTVATTSAQGIIAYPYLLGGLKLVQFSPPIGLVHQWLVRTTAKILGIELERAYTVFEEMAKKSEPGSGGVIFLPGSFRPGPKKFNIALTDITYFNDIKHIARAFYECSAFELRRTIEVFEKFGCKVSRIIVSGGGATPFWCQLKADVLGRAVEVPAVTETGCLGAALVAGYAVGLYPSLKEAASVVRIAKMYEPSKTYDYEERYHQYLEAREKYGQFL
jgi:sugar (pentulose or hexulose) kinase